MIKTSKIRKRGACGSGSGSALALAQICRRAFTPQSTCLVHQCRHARLIELIFQLTYHIKHDQHVGIRVSSFLHAHHLPIRCYTHCSHKTTDSLYKCTKSIAACLITATDLPHPARRSLTHLQHIVGIQGHHSRDFLRLQSLDVQHS